VVFVITGETTSTLEPWLFHLQFKPPTIPSIVSFGAGHWCTTERILQEPYSSGPFLGDWRQSSCGFS
jgi:hypothetical protein